MASLDYPSAPTLTVSRGTSGETWCVDLRQVAAVHWVPPGTTDAVTEDGHSSFLMRSGGGVEIWFTEPSHETALAAWKAALA